MSTTNGKNHNFAQCRRGILGLDARNTKCGDLTMSVDKINVSIIGFNYKRFPLVHKRHPLQNSDNHEGQSTTAHSSWVYRTAGWKLKRWENKWFAACQFFKFPLRGSLARSSPKFDCIDHSRIKYALILIILFFSRL